MKGLFLPTWFGRIQIIIANII